MYVYNESNKLVTRELWQRHNWLAKLELKLSRRLWAFAIPRLANMHVTLSYLAYPKKRFTHLLKHDINSCRVRDVNVVHNAEPKRHMQYVWNSRILTKREHLLNRLESILHLVNKALISLLISSSSHRSLRITCHKYLNCVTKESICPLALNAGKISHIA